MNQFIAAIKEAGLMSHLIVLIGIPTFMIFFVCAVVCCAFLQMKIDEINKKKQRDADRKEWSKISKVKEFFNFVNSPKENDRILPNSMQVCNIEVDNSNSLYQIYFAGTAYYTEQNFINRMNIILNNYQEANFIGMKLFKIFDSFYNKPNDTYTITFEEFDHLYNLIILQKYEKPKDPLISEMNTNIIKLQESCRKLEEKINSCSNKLDEISISRQNQLNI